MMAVVTCQNLWSGNIAEVIDPLKCDRLVLGKQALIPHYDGSAVTLQRSFSEMALNVESLLACSNLTYFKG
ncbi:hypothetical protein CapIbe_004679 [Capra ibex]